MNSLFRLIRDRQGSITIEMAFVIMGFVLLLAIIVDFGVVMLRQSKLERTNTSLTMAFRERVALYSEGNTLTKFESENVSQRQVDQLARMAKTLLGEPDVSLRVDYVTFASGTVRTVQTSQKFYYGPTRCDPQVEALADYQHLSPYSGFDRWMPLYRVTTCIPGRMSWYRYLISNDGSGGNTVDGLRASNIAIPR
jgi:tight adherence protein F